MAKHISLGLLAHVDAGKTTLAESILYTCGSIREMGRVDHGNAFLDNYALERERGITIFSKQAQIHLQDKQVTLLDTPGHVDFSAEMERTLQVLDYAILVISGADGVQGHVETLWRLLKRYDIPVFLFVNKMDQEGTDKQALLQELQEKLDERCVDFEACAGFGENLDAGQGPENTVGMQTESVNRIEGLNGEAYEEFLETVALCGEELMEEYLETGDLSVESLSEAIAERTVFPCFFGSALKLNGVEELLGGIARYTLQPEYPPEFRARVFKIARDTAGTRLTYLKVTGGSLRVKSFVSNHSSAADEKDIWEEKADQLRVYDGVKYSAEEEIPAGGICAVTGLTHTFAGQGLGYESENGLPVLEPVLTYQILLPDDSDPIVVLGQLKQLEEEDPQLHMVWREESREIHVQVMGEVQIEILKSLILERFGLEVTFGTGSIVYKETIAEPVVGIGHFEPLRHYAEVHLLLEPGEPGSGLQFASLCSEDMLDKNWQRLIVTHLEERIHPGVLTGSEVTDMRIVLLAGKAHQKHTEGGDFRQATYRAVRQGLRSGKSVLLEPVFAFTLEVPTQMLGRAMSDIQRMHGSFETPETSGGRSILTGSAPVACMRDYQREVNSYTRGMGRFSCMVKGYEPCHNAEEVIAGMQYEPEADIANPTGSVFCAHGAGFVVNWDEVPEYAHVENRWRPGVLENAVTNQNAANAKNDLIEQDIAGIGISAEDLHAIAGMGGKRGNARDKSKSADSASAGYITQEEIDAIFQQTYGQKPKENNHYRRYHRSGVRRQGGENAGTQGVSSQSVHSRGAQSARTIHQRRKESCLLVDGYNIIFAWEELKELAAKNIDSARDKLMDIMSNYQGYLGSAIILVFDAYKVKGNPGSVVQYHNIHVVYTKEAETADQYIEKTVHEIGHEYNVTVATSDALEQMIIWGDGAMRMSAAGLKQAVEEAGRDLREKYGITEY